MKKITLSVFFLALAFSLAKAQYYYDRSKVPAQKKEPVVEKNGRDFDHFYYLLGDLNQPTSNTAYINSASTFATKLGFRKRLNSEDRLWAGAELGYSVYKQHLPYQTYQYGTTSISAELYNYSVNYSLTGVLDYFFLPMENLVTPYVGFGLGVAYDKFSQYYNIYATSADSWGLQLRPEAGVLIGFKQNSSWRIKASFHYDYASNMANLVNDGFITPGENNYKNFVNYGFQIGIVKMAW